MEEGAENSASASRDGPVTEASDQMPDIISQALPLRGDNGSRPERELTPHIGDRETQDTGQDPIRPRDPEDLDTKREALLARQQELLKRQEIRNLEESVRILEKQEASWVTRDPRNATASIRADQAESQVQDPDLSTQDHRDASDRTQATTPIIDNESEQSIPSHKRGVSKTAEFPPTKVTRLVIKPSGMSQYFGRSQSEHRQWVREAETKFRQSPPYFVTDKDKILFTMDSLRGEPANIWFPYEKENRVTEEGPTWEFYTQFLLDLVKDPANRKIDDAQEYADARQREGQSAQAFHSYLQTLEARLPPYTEEQLVINYFTKIDARTRKHFLDQPNLPVIRSALVQLAQRFENNRREGPGSQGKGKFKKDKPEKKPEPPRSRSSGPSAQSQTNSSIEKRKSLKCFGCGGDHYKNKCPNRNASGVNQTEIGSTEQEAGKAKASQNPLRRRSQGKK
jgi:hypothetical protein